MQRQLQDLFKSHLEGHFVLPISIDLGRHIYLFIFGMNTSYGEHEHHRGLKPTIREKLLSCL
ncbi:hypothetical protein OIU77_030346 [Salix suchowensis]|uniref:Maturase K n=1 Tax=Salix suchowensis TaxID=1278906 RepID=A0ABQ9BBL7_9ROSI|nr:hypothetical protein OIU77_030346 [Salix suchowensis]